METNVLRIVRAIENLIKSAKSSDEIKDKLKQGRDRGNDMFSLIQNDKDRLQEKLETISKIESYSSAGQVTLNNGKTAEKPQVTEDQFKEAQKAVSEYLQDVIANYDAVVEEIKQEREAYAQSVMDKIDSYAHQVDEKDLPALLEVINANWGAEGNALLEGYKNFNPGAGNKGNVSKSSIEKAFSALKDALQEKLKFSFSEKIPETNEQQTPIIIFNVNINRYELSREIESRVDLQSEPVEIENNQEGEENMEQNQDMKELQNQIAQLIALNSELTRRIDELSQQQVKLTNQLEAQRSQYEQKLKEAREKAYKKEKNDLYNRGSSVGDGIIDLQDENAELKGELDKVEKNYLNLIDQLIDAKTLDIKVIGEGELTAQTLGNAIAEMEGEYGKVKGVLEEVSSSSYDLLKTSIENNFDTLRSMKKNIDDPNVNKDAQLLIAETYKLLGMASGYSEIVTDGTYTYLVGAYEARMKEMQKDNSKLLASLEAARAEVGRKNESIQNLGDMINGLRAELGGEQSKVEELTDQIHKIINSTGLSFEDRMKLLDYFAEDYFEGEQEFYKEVKDNAFGFSTAFPLRKKQHYSAENLINGYQKGDVYYVEEANRGFEALGSAIARAAFWSESEGKVNARMNDQRLSNRKKSKIMNSSVPSGYEGAVGLRKDYVLLRAPRESVDFYFDGVNSQLDKIVSKKRTHHRVAVAVAAVALAAAAASGIAAVSLGAKVNGLEEQLQEANNSNAATTFVIELAKALASDNNLSDQERNDLSAYIDGLVVSDAVKDNMHSVLDSVSTSIVVEGYDFAGFANALSQAYADGDLTPEEIASLTEMAGDNEAANELLGFAKTADTTIDNQKTELAGKEETIKTLQAITDLLADGEFSEQDRATVEELAAESNTNETQRNIAQAVMDLYNAKTAAEQAKEQAEQARDQANTDKETAEQKAAAAEQALADVKAKVANLLEALVGAGNSVDAGTFDRDGVTAALKAAVEKLFGEDENKNTALGYVDEVVADYVNYVNAKAENEALKAEIKAVVDAVNGGMTEANVATLTELANSGTTNQRTLAQALLDLNNAKVSAESGKTTAEEANKAMKGFITDMLNALVGAGDGVDAGTFDKEEVTNTLKGLVGNIFGEDSSAAEALVDQVVADYLNHANAKSELDALKQITDLLSDGGLSEDDEAKLEELAAESNQNETQRNIAGALNGLLKAKEDAEKARDDANAGKTTAEQAAAAAQQALADARAQVVELFEKLVGAGDSVEAGTFDRDGVTAALKAAVEKVFGEDENKATVLGYVDEVVADYVTMHNLKVENEALNKEIQDVVDAVNGGINDENEALKNLQQNGTDRQKAVVNALIELYNKNKTTEAGKVTAEQKLANLQEVVASMFDAFYDANSSFAAGTFDDSAFQALSEALTAGIESIYEEDDNLDQYRDIVNGVAQFYKDQAELNKEYQQLVDIVKDGVNGNNINQLRELAQNGTENQQVLAQALINIYEANQSLTSDNADLNATIEQMKGYVNDMLETLVNAGNSIDAGTFDKEEVTNTLKGYVAKAFSQDEAGRQAADALVDEVVAGYDKYDATKKAYDELNAQVDTAIGVLNKLLSDEKLDGADLDALNEVVNNSMNYDENTVNLARALISLIESADNKQAQIEALTAYFTGMNELYIEALTEDTIDEGGLQGKYDELMNSLEKAFGSDSFNTAEVWAAVLNLQKRAADLKTQNDNMSANQEMLENIRDLATSLNEDMIASLMGELPDDYKVNIDGKDYTWDDVKDDENLRAAFAIGVVESIVFGGEGTPSVNLGNSVYDGPGMN